MMERAAQLVCMASGVAYHLKSYTVDDVVVGSSRVIVTAPTMTQHEALALSNLVSGRAARGAEERTTTQWVAEAVVELAMVRYWTERGARTPAVESLARAFDVVLVVTSLLQSATNPRNQCIYINDKSGGTQAIYGRMMAAFRSASGRGVALVESARATADRFAGDATCPLCGLELKCHPSDAKPHDCLTVICTGERVKL